MKARILIIFVSAVLAFATLLATLQALRAAGGGLIYLPVLYRPATTCTVPSAQHPTIQSAADDTACGTITLTAALYQEAVTLTHNVKIHGQGPAATMVDAQEQGAVFYIQPGLNIVLSDMLLTNGWSLKGGAGVRNEASQVILENVHIIANKALAGTGSEDGLGGGVYNSGTMFITNTLIQNNAGRNGGGIYNTGKLSIHNSTLTGNYILGKSPEPRTAGIFNSMEAIIHDSILTEHRGVLAGVGGVLTMTNSLLQDNGMFLDQSPLMHFEDSEILISLSTLMVNEGYNWFFETQLTMVDTTVTENNGRLDLRGNSVGLFEGVTISGNQGCIRAEGDLTLINTTISSNACNAVESYGTTYIINSTIFDVSDPKLNPVEGTLYLANTILFDYDDFPNCMAAENIVSLGHNISDDDTCNLTHPGDLPNTDARIDDLRDNGGPTETHALFSISPAIDYGNEEYCPAVDQRGIPRPLDGNGDGTAVCDVGAFEREQ